MTPEEITEAREIIAWIKRGDRPPFVMVKMANWLEQCLNEREKQAKLDSHWYNRVIDRILSIVGGNHG